MRIALRALLAVLCASCASVSPTPDAAPTPDCGGQGRSRCVAQVTVGARFACAALQDQTVWCWGRNDEGQLGYETDVLCPEVLPGGQSRPVSCHLYPRQVSGLTGAVAASAGGAHACAVRAEGTLACWGGNAYGQLGNNAVLPSHAAVSVQLPSGVTAVAAGARHTCAIAQGNVWCWGANDRGQLGIDSAPSDCTVAGAVVPCARVPVGVPSVRSAVDLVAGDEHTCARTQSGRVYCWGTNVDGELGNGTAGMAPAPIPALVLLGGAPLSSVQALSAGGHHSCALRQDGVVLCWGRGDQGQLGVPPQRPPFAPCANACSSSAVGVAGFEGDTGNAGDAGAEAGDASAPDGMARDAAPDVQVADAARGDGSAEAGSFDVVVRDVPPDPRPAPGGVSTGAAQSCLWLQDGTVRCWGANASGELGNGAQSVGGPTLVSVIASPGAAATNPLQGARALESGGATTCVVLADRSLRCWGSNEFGVLGVGALGAQLGPVAVTW